MPSETWKDIKGYKGYYQVSDLGRVRSLDRTTTDSMGRVTQRKGATLRPCPDTHGYPGVNLTVNGSCRRRMVHSLVADTFIGSRPKGQQCRHKDGDRANPELRNLHYGTPAQNSDDAVRHGTTARGTRNSQAVLSERQVLRIYARFFGGETLRSLAEEYGVSVFAVHALTTGRTWSHLTGAPSRARRAL